MLSKIKDYILNYKLRGISQKVEFEPEEAIVIFSDPRGGSTWLSEILQLIPKTAVVWEPLHLNYNVNVREIGFHWRQYIPMEADWSEANRLFTEIFKGKVLNVNTTFLNKYTDYLDSSRLIVKFCRANAMIPWLCEQFQFKYKPLHLIRHPFAVVASQMKQGGWDQPFSNYLIPDTRYKEFYSEHTDFLKGIRTKEESLLVTWCITNRVPLSSANKKWIQIHYEELFLDPISTLRPIFDEWNIEMPEGIQEMIEKESSTTVTSVDVDNKNNQLAKWTIQFTDSQISRFLHILDYFGITEYSERVMPTNSKYNHSI